MENIKTENLDHLGLIAGMCKELKIAEMIDIEVGETAHNKRISFGQLVVCMILNGLGFVGRVLYLYSEYFEDKPLGHLLGDDQILPEQIDDNLLGRALDKLFELDVTRVFTKIALKAVKTLGIEVNSVHLDSTSFHLHGQYDSLLNQNESAIQIVPGYSKDHRPDLNQAVLQLITSNKGNIPLYMRADHGNSSDQAAFREIIDKQIESFKNATENTYFVGDSALYTEKTLDLMQKKNLLFVTRVPAKLKESKAAVLGTKKEELTAIGEGYSVKECRSTYGGVEQRWFVFFSEAAYARESKTLERHFLKGSAQEYKDFRKLTKKEFSCEKDAEKALSQFSRQCKYTELIHSTILERKKHARLGRPKKDSPKTCPIYQIAGKIGISLEKKAFAESSRGYFILSTNDLETENASAADILKIYKEQQSVERGFRFLKNPEFLVASFYLKKPERIEALLMMMTLSLLVYAAIEYKVRKNLVALDLQFPDQKKRASQKPTARWIFYCFLGLHVFFLNNKKKQVTNLKKRHEIILRCLGPPYEAFYYAEKWR